MPTTSQHVCLSVKTGSGRPIAKTTLLTLSSHGRKSRLGRPFSRLRRVSGGTLRVGAALLKCENALPVVFHIDDRPFIQRGGVQRFVEATKGRVPVVSIFAFGVGMMNNQAKAASTGHRRPLQHFEIAVRVAERSDRSAADILVDAHWLADVVVDEI